MSMWRSDFVIWGYDLSDEQDKILEWLDETEEGRACYAELHTEKVGKWSLFDDPADGDHFFLGFLLGQCDEADGFVRPVKIDIYDLTHDLPNRTLLPRAFDIELNDVAPWLCMDDGRLYVFSEWR